MSKMFTFNGKRMVTWNLFTGCNFNCSYCWARQLAETRLKASYPNGFIPTTHPDRFNRHFKPDDFVFPVSMGDIAFAPTPVWRTILHSVRNYPDTKFLLCTKAPSVYHNLQLSLMSNLYLGATLETNIKHPELSKAHPVTRRYHDMKYLAHPNKFISIEPIMDFDLNTFVQWILDINPSIVEVGADNYHHNLPEPSPDKLNMLLAEIKKFGRTVIEKQGLERLK